jgi:NAD(P)-dependent dehydrogenase (short-subunit alcohol dehydrogenase family)
MVMTQRFHDRVAVVTGSTQGVGETLLHRMADEGLRGAVVTGRDAERGAAVVDALAAKDCEAVFVPADLNVAASVEALVPAALERFGAVHHVANCAGKTDRGDVWNTTPEMFDAMMAVNTRAPFLTIQGLARAARDLGVPATAVSVGSVAGYGGAPFITPYSISKGALSVMTKTLANQLMRHGVRVNQVNPGWMDTPGEDAIQRRYHDADDGWLAAAEATRPFGRLIKMDELVATLAFVLSDESGMMTGAIIDYDQTVQGTDDAPTA